MNTPLTRDQQAQLRSALERRQQALQRQLAAHLHGGTRAERAHEVAQQDGDDAPQRAPEREIAMALTDHERARLVAVSDALARIDKNRYGVCSDCETEIPFGRLEVEPWATRCVACASRHELRRS